MKNILMICAILLASFSAPSVLAKEIEVVVTTTAAPDDTAAVAAAELRKETNTIVYKSDASGDTEFDSEVSQIVDEVIGELKQEWGNLDEQERQEVKDAIRSVGEGININIDPNMDIGSIMVTITAILFTLGSPILIVALLLFFSYRKRKQRAQLVEKFLDAGKDVPPEVLASFADNGDSGNNLQSGLKLCGIGMGIFLFFGLMIDWGIASVGLIPLCIGIARLLIWKLDKPAASDAPNTDTTA